MTSPSLDIFRFRDLPNEVQLQIVSILARNYHLPSAPHVLYKVLTLDKSCFRDFAPFWYRRALFYFFSHQNVMNKFLKIPPTGTCLHNLTHMKFFWDQGFELPFSIGSDSDPTEESRYWEFANTTEMLVNVLFTHPQLPALKSMDLHLYVIDGIGHNEEDPTTEAQDLYLSGDGGQWWKYLNGRLGEIPEAVEGHLVEGLPEAIIGHYSELIYHWTENGKEKTKKIDVWEGTRVQKYAGTARPFAAVITVVKK